MTRATFDFVVPSGTPLPPGSIFLRLYHGRKHPDQEMDGWGFNGPVFGPLSAVVMTYLTTVRLYGPSASDELWLDTRGDMVVWRGDYYGDFELFVASPNDKA
jgi:hypothetical protein